MMKNNTMYLFLIMTFCFVAPLDASDEIQRVTVFVHGTHLGVRKVGIILGMKERVDHENGLYPIEGYTGNYRYANVAKNIARCAPQYCAQEHTYFFCWSGQLSHEARVIAAEELHEALNTLALKYRKKCVVTLITQSHGGNVALNLTNVASSREYEIDILMFLAVPVQKVTSSYVDNALFKNVFALYSRWDFTQIADLQKSTSTGFELPLFSERVFASKRVKHIEVRQSTCLGNRPVSHLEFLFPHITRNIGNILDAAQTYDFSSEGHMIFNIQKSLFYDTYFNA